MKSIKSKLILFLGLLIGTICIGLGAVSFIYSSKALEANLSKTLPKIAEQTASSIQGKLEGHLGALVEIAGTPEIKNSNNPWEGKLPILLEKGKENRKHSNGDCGQKW